MSDSAFLFGLWVAVLIQGVATLLGLWLVLSQEREIDGIRERLTDLENSGGAGPVDDPSGGLSVARAARQPSGEGSG